VNFTLEVADFAGQGADLSGMGVMIGGAPCAALAALGNITLHCTGVAVAALLQRSTVDADALAVPLTASITTGGVKRILQRAGSVTTLVSVVTVSPAEVPVGGGNITVSGSGFALPGVVGGGGVSVSLGAGGSVSCGRRAGDEWRSCVMPCAGCWSGGSVAGGGVACRRRDWQYEFYPGVHFSASGGSAASCSGCHSCDRHSSCVRQCHSSGEQLWRLHTRC